MKERLAILCAAVLLMLAPAAIRADEPLPDHSESVAAARTFLELYDQENPEACWWAAAEVFRQSISLEEWNKDIQRNKALLGRALEIDLSKATALNDYPGYPDGEYVAVLFKVRTERKRNAADFVMTRLENGEWKVAAFWRR